MENEQIESKGTIAICTPMYGDVAHREYINSVLLISDSLRLEGYTTSLISLGNESIITRARNLLVHQALQIENLVGILFLDSDQGVNPEDVLSLIESGKDIIGGIVPKKSLNWDQVKTAVLLQKEDLSLYSGSFALNFIDNKDVKVLYNEPIEVKRIGTGLMYVSAKVFGQLKPKCNSFVNGYVDDKKVAHEITEYFKTSITEDTKELLSEDYYFCDLWRSIGGTVWAAPWVRVVHCGSYTFNGSFLHTVDNLARAQEIARSSSLGQSN